MLSLAFAENRSQMSVECWTYRGEAMRHIASLMETDQTALGELTIGAILVLTGVEVSTVTLYVSRLRRSIDGRFLVSIESIAQVPMRLTCQGWPEF